MGYPDGIFCPVDDARGNAEALLQIKDQYGLKIRLE